MVVVSRETVGEQYRGGHITHHCNTHTLATPGSSPSNFPSASPPRAAASLLGGMWSPMTGPLRVPVCALEGEGMSGV